MRKRKAPNNVSVTYVKAYFKSHLLGFGNDTTGAHYRLIRESEVGYKWWILFPRALMALKTFPHDPVRREKQTVSVSQLHSDPTSSPLHKHQTYAFSLTHPWIFEPVVYSNHRSKSPLFVEIFFKLWLIVHFFQFWGISYTLTSLPAHFPWLISQAHTTRPVRLSFFKSATSLWQKAPDWNQLAACAHHVFSCCN